MKNLFTSAAALIVLSCAFPVSTFSATAEQAFENCKSKAEAEEVDDADLKTWVTQCLKDEGISATDAKPLIDNEFSSDENETAKSSM